MRTISGLIWGKPTLCMKQTLHSGANEDLAVCPDLVPAGGKSAILGTCVLVLPMAVLVWAGRCNGGPHSPITQLSTRQWTQQGKFLTLDIPVPLPPPESARKPVPTISHPRCRRVCWCEHMQHCYYQALKLQLHAVPGWRHG